MPKKCFNRKEERRFSLTKNSFLSFCLALSLIIGLSSGVKAQRTGPEQQPCGAISLNCAPVFQTNEAYGGYIESPNENHYGPCHKTVVNSRVIWNRPVFFKFTANANGFFNFLITPNETADLDFWFVDVTNRPNSCNWSDIIMDEATYQLFGRCNVYTSYGATGASLTVDGPVCAAPSTCPSDYNYDVYAGRTYLLLVTSNLEYDDNFGFTLDASNSTPGVLTYPPPTFTYPNKLCLGNTATFTITNPNPAAIYTWSGPNLSSTTGTSVSATPTTIGNKSYTLTVTYPGTTCLPHTTNFTVAVGPRFTLNASASPARICRGQSVLLTASGAPTGSIYTWNGPGLVNAVGTSVSVTPVAGMTSPLTYTVKATSPTSTCEEIKTVQVIVDDPIVFSVNISPNNVCPGTQVTLTASSTIPNLQYTWYLPLPAGSVHSASTTVTATSTRPYTVSAYLPGSVCPIDEVYQDHIVYVNPPFNFNVNASSTKICAGSNTILSASPTNANYIWSGPGLSSTAGSSVIASPTTTTTYTVTGTSTTEPCPSTKTITITVDQPFPLNVTSTAPNICPGSSATLTATGLSSSTVFAWNFGGFVNSPGASKVVTPSVTTTYLVSAKDPANECAVAKLVTVGVNTHTPVTVGGNCSNICSTIGTPKLSVGDIAIIRYRGDPTDELVIVPLVNLPAGMQINFSDKGWNGTAFVNNTGDATFVYTVPAGGILAGTPTTISSAQYSFDIDDQGDQMFIFQGTEGAPEFIYGLNTAVWQTTGAITATNSYLPAVLTRGYTASDFPYERENGKYCPLPGSVNLLAGTRSQILYMIGDWNKWLRSGSPNFTPGDEVGVNANWSFNITPTYTSGVLWNTGSTANCIVSSAPGTYTVTHTDLHGCQSSASVTTPAFNFTLSTDRPKYCLGDQVTVTASGAPAGTTYQWSGYVAPATFTPNSVSFVPPYVNFTTSVTATAPGYGCTVTKTMAYAIDVPFTFDASASPANVCPGGSTTLTATGLSANTVFTWNGGSLSNAAGATQVIAPTVLTTYAVTAKDPANECYVNKQVSVGVYVDPSITVTGGNGSCNDVTDFCAHNTNGFTLAQGDLVILRYRADAPDEFVFVPLVDLTTGTQIKFTDRGWYGTGFVNSSGDNTYIYTAPANITAGTVITLTGLDLSDLGDQVIAYQGADATPTLLYAFNSDRWLTTGTVTANSSYLPTGLINGYTAVDFPYERDNAKYFTNSTPITLSGTPSSILNQVGTEANWFRSNTPTTGTDPVGVNSNWVFNITPAAFTSGYVWNTGATTQCISIYNTDTYTVTYTDLHGCTSSVSKTKDVPFDIAPEWATYFGPNVMISDIKISPVTGNLIICGTGTAGDYVPAPVNPANIRYYGESSLTSPTGTDYYKTIVAEVSKNGNEVLWVDYVNTKSWNSGTKLDIDVNGDIYVNISYTGDPASSQPAIMKLNNQGVQQWLVKDFFKADVSYWGINITTTADGLYILFTADCAQSFPGAVNACQGLLSAGVMKISKVNGSPIWTSFFGGTGGEHTRSYGYDITHDDLGDIYFIGDASYMPGNNSLSLLPPSSTYSTAILKPTGNPIVVKMNPAGAVVWWDLLSEPSFENNYTSGIAVRNNHLYTSNFSGIEWGPSSFNEQVIHRRDATTGTLLFSKTLSIDYTVQPLLDNLFRVYDLTVDEHENVYLTGDLAYASMSLVMPGAENYHDVLTNPTSRVHGDLETFVMCFSGTNLNPKWFTYYGVDPTVTTRYSEYQKMNYLSRAIVTDGDGATYIAGIATGDYNRFEVVDQSAGTPVVDGSNAGSSKGIIVKLTCEASQQIPQARMKGDNAAGTETAIAYPNPFTNNTMIKVNGLEGELNEVTVYSMEGVVLFKQQHVASGQTLEVGEGFVAGMYFVQVRGDKGTNTSVKIIKR